MFKPQGVYVYWLCSSIHCTAIGISLMFHLIKVAFMKPYSLYVSRVFLVKMNIWMWKQEVCCHAYQEPGFADCELAWKPERMAWTVCLEWCGTGLHHHQNHPPTNIPFPVSYWEINCFNLSSTSTGIFLKIFRINSIVINFCANVLTILKGLLIFYNLCCIKFHNLSKYYLQQWCHCDRLP